jgi:hypothetical protein
VVECGGLENRCASLGVPRVRIPPPPLLGQNCLQNAHGCAWASQWTTVRRCPCPCGVFTHRGRARGAGTPEALDSVDPPTGGCAGGDLGLTRPRIGGDVAARAERREIIRHSRIRVPQTPQPRARAKAGIRGDRRRQSPTKKPRRPQKRPHHRHPRPDPRTTPLAGLPWSSGLAFGRSPTTPFEPSTVTERAYRLWGKAGLEKFSLHEARHSGARGRTGLDMVRETGCYSLLGAGSRSPMRHRHI